MPGIRSQRVAIVFAAVLALGLGLAGCSSTPTAQNGSAPVSQDSGTPANIATVSPLTGGVAGGTTLTVHGSGLAVVKTVKIGGTAVVPTSRTTTNIAVTVPAANNFATGPAAITLLDGSGATVYSGTFNYTIVDGLDRQMHYLLTYWKHYNPAYQALPDDDCVDFTSQSLLERGWKPQGDWTPDAANIADSGLAWRSSTSFRDFMEAHPSLGTALTDAERDKVKVGDIVQFDWDKSGDRDHTGVVTRVTHTSHGTEIYFAGHTNDSDYRSVDTAITKDHPGGVAYYWSLK